MKQCNHEAILRYVSCYQLGKEVSDIWHQNIHGNHKNEWTGNINCTKKIRTNIKKSFGLGHVKKAELCANISKSESSKTRKKSKILFPAAYFTDYLPIVRQFDQYL